MSQYYTVRQTSRNETEVIVPAAANSNGSVVSKPNHLNNPRSLTTTTTPTKVQIVETAVQIDSENGGHHGHHGQARLVNSADHRGGVETVQLMAGMASTLPSSNLFVNYPHTMWERDSDGNRIPVTVVKAEESNAAEVSQEDLLVQAANIKTESGDGVDSNTTVTTITIPANASAGNSSTGNPNNMNSSSTSAILNSPSGAQRIVVMKTAGGSASAVTHDPSNGEPVSRPHVCEICTKTFAKREHLTKHLRIHKSDNKRYSCEYCQKAFRDRYELVRHTRRHTGDFPFR